MQVMCHIDQQLLGHTARQTHWTDCFSETSKSSMYWWMRNQINCITVC